MTQMNELGFYTLAGALESPRELIDSRAHRDRAWMPTTPG